MEENKEILELLQKIEKTNRQQVRSSRLLCILMIVTALCCAAAIFLVSSLLPQVTTILPRVDAVLTQMQTVLGNLELTSSQLASVDFGSMVDNVDSLVITGQQSLQQTMDKLNTIDFDALNQAIQNLADVVEPLARFFNIFN